MSEPTAFPLDESKLPFKIPKDTKPREKIMKLGQMITDRVPAKLRRLTVEDPEYWGLASIVTDEMADVALKMKVRQPMTLPELEKATGKPAKELEPLLYQMSCVGLLEYNWENPRREKQYIPRSLKAGCCAVIKKSDVRTPVLFDVLAKEGNIPERDMFNTFNMGVGMILTVAAEDADKAIEILKANGEDAYRLGVIGEGSGVQLV